MCALYAFLRVTDDLADSPGEVEAKRVALKQWRDDLRGALVGRYRHPCHAALHHTVARFGIPAGYLEAVIDGVEMDLGPVDYANFAALYRYCYHVASAVGLACIHIWGYRDVRARTLAEHAGVALQLTNILRDLPEDAERGRFYLPAEDRKRFGCERECLRRGPVNPAFRDLMRFEAQRARRYYESAEGLTQFLAPAGRAVFEIILRTYRGLLDELERRDYDVFSARVSLSRRRKLGLVLRALPARWGYRAVGSTQYPGQGEGQEFPSSLATAYRLPPTTVLIVGGGLAGLSAAAALAPRGYRVALLESRNRLGGRAGSFTDAATGQVIDACQHVSMGCCTRFARFSRTVGIDHFLAPQPALYFMTPDRQVSRFGADTLPAPLHLARSFAGAHFLSRGDKVRIVWGLTCLMRMPPCADPPFCDWLLAHGQTRRTIDRFWGLVLVSALNESVDRVGLRYARKVFRDGFVADRRGFEVQVPTVPLGRLYGAELSGWLARHGVDVRLNEAATAFEVADGRVTGVRLRSGAVATADYYVSALPFDRLFDLLPDEVTRREAYFAELRNLNVTPIASVHLWFDRPVTDLPHAVLVDCVGQWVFNRGEVRPGEYYLQVVISAARGLRGLGGDEIQRRIVEEMRQLFPGAADATLLRGRVVTEHAATFSAVPGVDRWRPAQESPLANLFVAGDWTATGWPATMEGAVRSGELAAQALYRRAVAAPGLRTGQPLR